MSRTSNSLRNIKFAVVGQILALLISFIARMVFIRMLNTEYLGLNGLFSNILAILALAELGIGTAIVYSMYKPLADNDIRKLKALMNLYKKFFISIGILIMMLGIAFSPFLKYTMKEIPDIPNIQGLFLIYVATTAISYFYSYKRALIVADQKKYIDSYYYYTFFIAVNVVQMFVLIITANFMLFLIIKLIFVLIENISISYKADKMYPFLKERNIEKLEDTDKSTIVKNIKAMFIHRLGTVVVMATDNLLISKFVGILAVGLYSNYLLVIQALGKLYSIVFQSIIASVGNLGATESKEKLRDTFNFINFINFWIIGFSSIALINLINPFIRLWLGEELLFSNSLVLLIVINFYLNGLRYSVLTFRDALGLFWYDRYKPLLESLVNLIGSIILVQKYGVAGVLLGTTISTITTVFWIEPYIVHKYGLNNTSKIYYIKYLFNTFVIIMAGLLTYFLCNLINNFTIVGFIGRVAICALVPNFLLLLIYHKTDEFKYCVGIGKRILSRTRSIEM